MHEKIEFRKVRDFGEVLNASFFFIRQNIKPLFLNLLFIAGPFILVGSVLPGLLIFPMFGEPDPMANAEQFGLSFLTSMLVNILSFIVGAVMAAGTVYEYMLLYMEGDGRQIQAADIWKALRRDFFTILFTLAGLVLIFTFGFVMLGTFIVMVLGPFAGFLGFIILGLYLTVTFSLVLIIRLCEGVNFFKAIERSIQLTRSKWWQTFTLLVICYIIQSALIWFIFTPFYIFFIAQEMLSPDTVANMQSGLIVAIIAGVLLVLAVMASFCLMLVVTGFQYFNLVERKDATGLLNRIRNMGTPAPHLPDYSDEEGY